MVHWWLWIINHLSHIWGIKAEHPVGMVPSFSGKGYGISDGESFISSYVLLLPPTCLPLLRKQQPPRLEATPKLFCSDLAACNNQPLLLS